MEYVPVHICMGAMLDPEPYGSGVVVSFLHIAYIHCFLYYKYILCMQLFQIYAAVWTCRSLALVRQVNSNVTSRKFCWDELTAEVLPRGSRALLRICMFSLNDTLALKIMLSPYMMLCIF